MDALIVPHGHCVVKTYPNGGKLVRAGQYHCKPPNSGGKRKAISGWSYASRRRFRTWMVEHTVPEGWNVYGVTLTIPGPVLELSACRLLFNRYQKSVERAGVAAVWRVEVQLRGQLHWHLLIAGPGDPDRLTWLLVEQWHRAIDGCGPVRHETKEGVYSADSRMALPGALQRAADVQVNEDGSQAWLRYLLDHASKSKQEQTGENIGRHWGVIGKKRWKTATGVEYRLTDRQYIRLCRAFEKLCQGSRGKRYLRGRRGCYATFTSPDTLRRLVEYARTTD